MITYPLSCSQCGDGHYVQAVNGEGVCTACEHTVNIWRDVVPHLDEGEHITILSGDVVAVSSPDEDDAREGDLATLLALAVAMLDGLDDEESDALDFTPDEVDRLTAVALRMIREASS